MKRYFVFFILLIISFSISAQKQNDGIFKGLYLLEGKWIMKTKKGSIGEEWKKMNDHYLQSRGYLVRGNDTITTETVALENTRKGIFYTSTVKDQNNQQPVGFKLSSAKNNIFVFENPGHDYPKKITYRFINKDSLNAWIDDGKEIPVKKSSFFYSRQQ